MTIQKSTYDLGVPWEEAAGDAQAVKVGDTVYISGQPGHKADGTLVLPQVANTTVATPALTLLGQVVEIKFTARV